MLRGIVGEDKLLLVELRVSDCVEVTRPGGCDRVHCVQRTGEELRVIEDVDCLAPEFELVALRERDAFESAQIEVVDSTGWQAVLREAVGMVPGPPCT